MKTCTKCNEEKELTEFNKRGGQCKGCVSAYNREYREARRDSINAKRRAQYKEDPTATLERNLRYREQNRESISERDKRYRTENADVIKRRKVRYRKENPELFKRWWANRRALKQGAYVEGAYIPTYQELVEFYGTHCMIEGCTNTDTTYDHIVAYQNGGKHALWNLQPMCMSHNCGKRDRHSTDYRMVKWVDRIKGNDVIYRPYVVE